MWLELRVVDRGATNLKDLLIETVSDDEARQKDIVDWSRLWRVMRHLNPGSLFRWLLHIDNSTLLRTPRGATRYSRNPQTESSW